ncbi:uncharacterized protein ISCGN_007604 [Ixodes scapularis]
MVLRYCPRCPYFSEQFTRVLTHIGVVHGGEDKFTVLCGINGCTNSYNQFVSYKSHIYRCHRDVLLNTGSSFSSERTNDDPRDFPSTDENRAYDDVDEPASSLQSEASASSTRSPKRKQFEDFVAEAKAAIWNFFFNVTENHKLPHSAATKIFGDLQLVFEHVIKAFADEIAAKIDVSALPPDVISLLECSFLPDLFKGIQSKHLREQYAKANFPYVEPESCKLNAEGGEYHYVPIPRLLRKLCEIPDIAAELVTPQARCDDAEVYRDFSDGLLFRDLKDLISEGDQYTIFILLYSDEVEICNPLGAKRGVHKLLAVYFTLLNLHARHRSQLRSIFLVLLARYEDVQEYGLDVILRPLLNDLKELHSCGVMFISRGETHNAHVFVFCVCGDNLSMNRLGGFTCCFSQGRVCRFCMATSGKLSTLTTEDFCVLRSAEAHQEHLQAITVNPKQNKRIYGVNERSPMLELPYFDVTRQLPPDLMHDILEGGFEIVLRQVLKALVDDGILAYSDLDHITSFEYGHNDKKNKPVGMNRSFLTNKANLKGTASEKWCLLRLLSLILGNLVPEDNPDWELYLQFREIVDLSFATVIPCEYLPYLESLVQTFLVEFAQRYGAASVIPKLHYLVHYARFIRELGPLQQFWSMRFEAKHQYFKSLASRVKNFKNITLTLSKRHQLLQSHQLNELSLDCELMASSGKPIKQSALPPCVQGLLPPNAHQVLHASLDHRDYRCGDVLVKASQDIEPVFYRVEALYVASCKLFILAELLTNEGFHRHRFCYCVRRSGELELVEANSDDTLHCALDLYNNSEVVLKWEVC